MSKEGDAIKLLLAGLKRQVDGLEERQLKWTRVADGAAYRVMELEKKLAAPVVAKPAAPPPGQPAEPPFAAVRWKPNERSGDPTERALAASFKEDGEHAVKVRARSGRAPWDPPPGGSGFGHGWFP